MSEDETKQEDTQVIKMPTPAELEGGEDDDEEGEEEDDGVVVYTIGLRHSAPVIAFDPRPPIDLLPAFGLARQAALQGGDPFFVLEGDEDGIGAAVVSIPDVVAIGVAVSDEELRSYMAPDPEDDDDEEDEPETPVERVQREAAERRERKKAEKIARQQVEAAAAEKTGKKNKKGLKGIV